MRKIALGLILVVWTAGQVFAWPADEKKWLACKQDKECTSVKLGCTYWQPVNKKYADAMTDKYTINCPQNNPPGPQPSVFCVDRVCTKPKGKLLEKK